MSQSISRWSLWCLVVLLALQAIPFVGALPILLGVAVLCGFVANLVLVSIVFDVAAGMIAGTWLLLPIFVYGGYFGIFAWQSAAIPLERRDLKLNNPAAVVAFDANQTALIVPSELAEALVSNYAIPVVYAFNSFSEPESFSSYRLLSEAGCQAAKDALARARSTGPSSKALHDVVLDRREGQDDSCILRMAEAPREAKIVVAVRGGVDRFDPPTAPTETTYDFSLGGQNFATYRTAGVGRLPLLPEFWIGCLPRGESQLCGRYGAGVIQTYEEIDATPTGIDAGPNPSPIAVTLGLRRYEVDELQRLRAAQDAGEVVSMIESALQRHIDTTNNPEEALWARMVVFLTDPNSDVANYLLPREALDFLPNWASRLSPYASALVANYVRLASDPKQLGNRWREALLQALIILPRSAYAALSDEEVKSLYGTVRANAGDKWVKDSDLKGELSELYVRIADAGPRALPYFEADLETFGAWPALAICRNRPSLGPGAGDPARAVPAARPDRSEQ